MTDPPKIPLRAYLELSLPAQTLIDQDGDFAFGMKYRIIGSPPLVATMLYYGMKEDPVLAQAINLLIAKLQTDPL